MAQEQTKRGGGGDEDDVTDLGGPAGQERREKLAEDTDDLLDEIDDVLEENAEDFVRAYVQKGWPVIWRDESIAPPQLTRHSHLSSFSEYLRVQAPELLPALGKANGDVISSLPHGTTIVALTYRGGVLIAGDRRATQGNYIANRDIDKVQITDNYSATGIAGTAAIAVEFARLYAVELEHYEKLEGVSLTFNGKANRLSALVRGNLAAAMQGLVAVPLLVGYDIDDPNGETAGRIVSFDVAGGWHVESDGYQAVGSGSMFAKSSIKKLYKSDGDALSALSVAVEALYDAAEDDSATGGPDLVRRVFPTAIRIDSGGAIRVPEADIERIAREVIQRRTEAAQEGDPS